MITETITQDSPAATRLSLIVDRGYNVCMFCDEITKDLKNISRLLLHSESELIKEYGSQIYNKVNQIEGNLEDFNGLLEAIG